MKDDLISGFSFSGDEFI